MEPAAVRKAQVYDVATVVGGLKSRCFRSNTEFSTCRQIDSCTSLFPRLRCHLAINCATAYLLYYSPFFFFAKIKVAWACEVLVAGGRERQQRHAGKLARQTFALPVSPTTQRRDFFQFNFIDKYSTYRIANIDTPHCVQMTKLSHLPGKCTK